jgi:hypothetical protein
MARPHLIPKKGTETRTLRRSDVVAAVAELGDSGFLQHVVGEHAFEDKPLFYRFQKHTQPLEHALDAIAGAGI